jgi:hypothetical protein
VAWSTENRHSVNFERNTDGHQQQAAWDGHGSLKCPLGGRVWAFEHNMSLFTTPVIKLW